MNFVRFLCVAASGLTLACGGGSAAPDLGVLDQCLEDGGTLSEAAFIDNNAVFNHGEITTLAFSSTGQIAFASTDGAIKLWSILGDSENPPIGYAAAFGEGNPPVRALGYAPDGSWIVSGRENGVVNTWDPSTGIASATFSSGPDAITSVAVSPDGQRVAIADTTYAGNMRVWSPGAVAKPGPALATELWEVEQVLYLANGQLAVAGHIYGAPAVELRASTVVSEVLWTWQDLTRVTPIRSVAVSPDQQTLVAVGNDLIALFDLSLSPPAPAYVEGASGNFLAVQFTPDGTHFVTVDAGGQSRSYSADGTSSQAGLTIPDVVGMRGHPARPQVIMADRAGRGSVVGCSVR